ncbi:hypothetical protein CDL15_Pgr000972 [Punica granatum]|uniref:Glycosyltransferase n=1 Tax=Punica granatum TaxID=22663 RepID=A0A218XJN1_PUNGR|nr:hypothetical protein CDL15_Pgr000972 [Punica granatum]
MSLLPEKHIAVLPFIGASHFQPLVNLVLKLAAAAPRALFSLLIATGDKRLLSCSDLPVNVKLYEAISSPWLSPPPGKSRKEKMQQFLEGAPRTYEMAIAVAEEAAGVKVSCLMTDVFFTFASMFAEKMQAKWIALWVAAPHGLSAYVYSDFIIQKYLRDDEARSQPDRTLEGIPGLSRMHVKDLPEALQGTYLDDMFILYRIFREIGRVLPQADAVLLNSHEEVTDADLVADLKSKFQKLLLVGSLTVSFAPPPLDSESDRTGCLSWLDEQKPRTVAYICFGSVVDLPPEEMFILAEALETSRTPYLWSLKDPMKVHLPPGFEERTRSHGKIVPWAPQSQVLWHPSIGAHITHCGYNSVFECVAGEVPVICRPLWADGRMHAIVVEEEWGIGVTVDGGTMTKDRILRCLEMVMGGGEAGKKMRQKIRAFKEVLIDAAGPNGSASRDLNTLLGIISL